MGGHEPTNLPPTPRTRPPPAPSSPPWRSSQASSRRWWAAAAVTRTRARRAPPSHVPARADAPAVRSAATTAPATGAATVDDNGNGDDSGPDGAIAAGEDAAPYGCPPCWKDWACLEDGNAADLVYFTGTQNADGTCTLTPWDSWHLQGDARVRRANQSNSVDRARRRANRVRGAQRNAVVQPDVGAAGPRLAREARNRVLRGRPRARTRSCLHAFVVRGEARKRRSSRGVSSIPCALTYGL